jgi:3-hydroxyisobutyrate dehydrogenase-like beta-hydroxyacid dehydrogenase
MRVAFLGLGIMGHAMATNLVKAGHEVTVWNRTPGKQVEGAGSGADAGGGGAGRGSGVAYACPIRRRLRR